MCSGYYNVLSALLTPSNLVVTAGLVGASLLPTRFVRIGKAVIAASILLMAIIGFSPLGRLLLIPLEERFPGSVHSTELAGIVVLGGPADSDTTIEGWPPPSSHAIKRLVEVVRLAHQHPNFRIVFTGRTHFHKGELSNNMLETLRIPSDRVLLDRTSRNTAESARGAKVLAEPKPGEQWLLVTSAAHMPRAIGAFRKIDFPVEPYPVDWRTNGPHDSFSLSGSVSRGFERTDLAAREWTGLLLDWLCGRSSELFPRPHEAEVREDSPVCRTRIG